MVNIRQKIRPERLSISMSAPLSERADMIESYHALRNYYNKVHGIKIESNVSVSEFLVILSIDVPITEHQYYRLKQQNL